MTPRTILAVFATAVLLLFGCSKSSEAKIDPNSPLGKVEAALEAKDYSGAVSNMLVYQRQQLTPEQEAQARNEMYKLQQALADAAAEGDDSAQAAANQLRGASALR